MPNKMSLDFAGFAEMRNMLNKLGADTKAICEEALVETHSIVTKKAEDAISEANLPAGGKYSTGDTLRSLERNPKVTWKGTEGSIGVGFRASDNGLASIFLIRGTPRMPKVQALYDAFYSDQTIGEVAKAQKDIFYRALERLE